MPRLERAQRGRGALERGRVGAGLDKDAPRNAAGLGYSRSAEELEAERARGVPCQPPPHCRVPAVPRLPRQQ